MKSAPAARRHQKRAWRRKAPWRAVKNSGGKQHNRKGDRQTGGGEISAALSKHRRKAAANASAMATHRRRNWKTARSIAWRHGASNAAAAARELEAAARKSIKSHRGIAWRSGQHGARRGAGGAERHGACGVKSLSDLALSMNIGGVAYQLSGGDNGAWRSVLAAWRQTASRCARDLSRCGNARA